MTDGPLGRIYTLQEAADYLRVTKQSVARAARAHGIGSRFGRDVRFSDADVTEIWNAMRAPAHTTNMSRTRGVVALVRDPLAGLRKQALAEKAAKAATRKNRRPKP